MNFECQYLINHIELLNDLAVAWLHGHVMALTIHNLVQVSELKTTQIHCINLSFEQGLCNDMEFFFRFWGAW